MKKRCHIQSVWLLLLLSGVLLFTAACTKPPAGPPPGAQAAQSTEKPPALSSQADAPAPSVVIPMDKVPEAYYHADKSKLIPAGETRPGSPNDIYKDKDGTQYEFDKDTGAYRGFVPPIHSGFGAAAGSIAMDTLEKTADELASHFVQASAYERVYFYQEDTSVHKFTYYKKAGGYRTADRGNVWISSDGNVELVSFINTGIFDKIEIPAIDPKALDEAFYKSLGETVCQKIWERTLTVKEGEVYLLYDYDYSFTAQGTKLTARDERYIKV